MLYSAWLAVAVSSAFLVHSTFALRGAGRYGGSSAWTKFPTLDDTLEMARLSNVVYGFSDGSNSSTCETYHDEYGTNCEWYYHDMTMGTQVLIVTNSKKKYIAVVYAGTNDVRTTLEDVDVRKKKFGDKKKTVRLPSDANTKALVHAGFDNAVFDHDVWAKVYAKVRRLRLRHPLLNLWTTGHSLGAANAILTALALAIKGYTVTTVNFGCPQTGNEAWNQFFGTYVPSSKLKNRLGIWRVVLGSDIIPRMPDFFQHGGHTIQLWSDSHYHDQHYVDDVVEPAMVQAFYNHVGDSDQDYAGVPSGWAKWSHIWNPDSVLSHRIQKYTDFLESIQDSDVEWVSSFERTARAPADVEYFQLGKTVNVTLKA